MEEVQAYLEDAYCGYLSVETSQLGTLEEREWVADRFEELKKTSFSAEERRRLAKVMLESQVDLRRSRVSAAPEVALHIQPILLALSCVLLTIVGI